MFSELWQNECELFDILKVLVHLFSRPNPSDVKHSMKLKSKKKVSQRMCSFFLGLHLKLICVFLHLSKVSNQPSRSSSIDFTIPLSPEVTKEESPSQIQFSE
jgi:cytoskeletal protein RodZ